MSPVPADDDLRTIAARIRGRVQGVGYREACVQQAASLGVTGWVRNRADGSVEAVLQGRPGPLAAMREWLARGPSWAHVDDVAVETLPASTPRFERFERRPSA